MKAIVRAVQIQIRLLVISALIIIMPQLVVDGHKVVGVDFDAHFDAQIIDIVDIPCGGMTNDFAIGWFDKL